MNKFFASGTIEQIHYLKKQLSKNPAKTDPTVPAYNRLASSHNYYNLGIKSEFCHSKCNKWYYSSMLNRLRDLNQACTMDHGISLSCSLVKSDDFARINFWGASHDSYLMNHTLTDRGGMKLLLVFPRICINAPNERVSAYLWKNPNHFWKYLVDKEKVLLTYK